MARIKLYAEHSSPHFLNVITFLIIEVINLPKHYKSLPLLYGNVNSYQEIDKLMYIPT